jgi:predicted esterase
MFSWSIHPVLLLVMGGLLLVTSCFTGIASAQVERYELGKRVERFEIAWQSATPESRARSVKPIAAAVQSFFALQLNKAGELIDQGFLEVTEVSSPTDFQRWALSQYLSVDPILSDQDSTSITSQLIAFYEVAATPPNDAQVELTLQSAEGITVASTQVDVPTLVAGHSWPLPDLGEGDYVVRAKVTVGDQQFDFPHTHFSRINNVQQRIKNIDTATDDKTSLGSPTFRASVRSWNVMFRSVFAKNKQETDYPLYEWMNLAEKLIAEPTAAAAEIRNHASKTDCWLTLSADGKNLPIRIRAPKSLTAKLPVLIAFHGAGGSENLFFEAYGTGRAIQMATERGWLVVAPRQSLLGMGLNTEQMLKALEVIFDVDRSKVLLMGHSMGAAQVIQQVAASPDLPAAAVAIGGGRRIASPESAGNFPWFVAAGELDFGRPGAKALADSLQKADKNVVYRDYPDIEHLIIVQAALDDVFSFFDSVLQPENK